MSSEEWLQQRDHEEWERICSLSSVELDAALIARGWTVDELDAFTERIRRTVERALARWRQEEEANEA